MTQRLPPSALALIATNLVPLAGVLFWDWKVLDIMTVFWMENVVIGLINILKMATIAVAKKDAEVIGLVPFFTFHYGIFTSVHGIFIKNFFDPGAAHVKGMDFLGQLPIPHGDLVWAAAGLFVSHLFSFFTNFIGQKEYEGMTVKLQMFLPYGRIVILHLTVLLGGFLAERTGQSVWALAFLVLLKIIIDVGAHTKERGKTAAPAEVSA